MLIQRPDGELGAGGEHSLRWSKQHHILLCVSLIWQIHRFCTIHRLDPSTANGRRQIGACLQYARRHAQLAGWSGRSAKQPGGLCIKCAGWRQASAFRGAHQTADYATARCKHSGSRAALPQPATHLCHHQHAGQAEGQGEVHGGRCGIAQQAWCGNRHQHLRQGDERSGGTGPGAAAESWIIIPAAQAHYHSNPCKNCAEASSRMRVPGRQRRGRWRRTAAAA